MVIKKSKALTVAAEGETFINDKNEKIGSWDHKQQENLEQELAQIPFEELQKARADGSHVIRLNTAYMQPDKPGRANKNRPMEMSSKVRVGRYREVIQAPKRSMNSSQIDVNGTSKSKRKNFIWSLKPEWIAGLLQIIMEYVNANMRSAQGFKDSVYQGAAQKMKEKFGIEVTGEQCKNQLRHQRSVWNHIQELKQKSGVSWDETKKMIVMGQQEYASHIQVVRDPRFESLCGNLDTEGFKNRYSFLYEVELPAEKAKLQKLIKKSKDPNIIEDLKNHISWIDKQLKSSSPKNIESEILSEHIKKEKEAAKHGKHPYYLKKSVIRERKLIKKYNELKASGKLDSFIEKKRKKNASKDHRFMPYRKSSDDVQR